MNAIFVRRKIMYLQTCGSFKSAKKGKRLAPQITNPQSATFAECPQMEKIFI
jgi:hypothetical protein